MRRLIKMCPFPSYLNIFILTLLACFKLSSALVEIKLYEDFTKKGESLYLSINNCTNLPVDWQDRTSSVHIYQSVCIKVFEHSGCKGKYITLRAAHHSDSEYLDNLKDLNFNDVISSVSPCSLQIEDGRYVLQNLGDNKMLTVANEGIYGRVYSKYWRNLNTQHWDVSQVPGSDILYEIMPVMYPNHIEKPIVYDKKDFKTLREYKKTKPTFLIESVDDWKYAIKEARSKMCLTTGTILFYQPVTITRKDNNGYSASVDNISIQFNMGWETEVESMLHITPYITQIIKDRPAAVI